MSNEITPAVLDKLRKFDTPTISNAIELFEVLPRTAGYMDQRIRAAFHDLPPMVGFATTATFRSSEKSPGADVYANLEKQVELFSQLPGPAVAVYQDLDDPTVGVTCGEVICSGLQAFGGVGLITSGGVRDLDQVRALGFPLFSEHVLCSHAYGHTIDIGGQVSVGGLEVRQGDLLHGDLNGVTRIPIEIAAELADVAEEFVAAEAPVIEYAQAPGEKSIAAFVELRKQMSQAFADLTRRVSRKT